MSTIEASVGSLSRESAAILPAEPSTTPEGAAPDTRTRPRRLAFWICRYLPAEVAGTAAMILAGLGVTVWTDNPALIAVAALVGEIFGFYIVLAITVYGEQWVHVQDASHARRRALVRTFGLLVAEFGAAELLDTLLIRPAALMIGVWLAGPMWGMIAGKVVADVVFYAVAAGAFTLTVRAGLRERRSDATAAADSASVAEVIA